MVISRRISLVVCLAVLAAVFASESAVAAPITVNLRVEGSTKTLFEGPVSTEAIPASPGISTASSGGPHPCDFSNNGSNGGFPPAAATATSALYQAVTASGLVFDAEWFGGGFNDFFIKQVGPTDISGKEAWGYAVNYTTAEVGGCQFKVASGSDVLFAYNYFGLPHKLSLTGPSAAGVGSPFTVHVADGETGAPVSGAVIGELSSEITTPLPSSPTTDTSGNATVSLTASARLKATRAESVRSNGLVVCVHNGNDGTCGTTVTNSAVQKVLPPTPTPLFEGDVARIAGIKSGHVYRRRSAPRVLSGLVDVRSGGTLRQVRISLERRDRGRCFEFSGARVRFVRVKRCGVSRFFSVGSAASFSYLLPAPLPRGSYVFQIEAVESTGKVTKPVEGISHVVFRVR
jgi:hypothetical protein